MSAPKTCSQCGACCRLDVYLDDWEYADEVRRFRQDPKLKRMVKEEDHPYHVGATCFTMRKKNDGHCVALRGKVGGGCRCSIYPDRPYVCRMFAPGCDCCLYARRVAGVEEELECTL